jgi:hypothetical protein
MEKFYLIEPMAGVWTFFGNVPASLRDKTGRPMTYGSKRDALDSAFWNGFPFVEHAAISEYSY